MLRWGELQTHKMDQPLLFFKAPWSFQLTIITTSSCALMAAISVSLVWLGDRQNITFLSMLAFVPLLTVLIISLYGVRGYLVTNNLLQISRLGWFTKISLATLESINYDPTAMDSSLRLFGNGGLFAFTGRFRNRKLGNYQAYATNPRLAVVLGFAEKTVVITPERPEEFVKLLTRAVEKQL